MEKYFGAPFIVGGDDFENLCVPGQMIGPGYKMLNFINDGGFSTVWKGQDQAGRDVVVKFYLVRKLKNNRRRRGPECSLIREIDILDKVNKTNEQNTEWDEQTRHWRAPNARVICPLELFTYMMFSGKKTANIYACISMPYYPTSLSDYLKKKKVMAPALIKEVNLQLIRALRHLHAAGYVHCDIKPGNIMLTLPADKIIGPDDISIVLIDFNTCFEMGSKDNWRAGTWDYMAPEMAIAKRPEPNSDLWSVSALSFELLTGNILFNIDDFSFEVSGTMHSRPENIDDWLVLYNIAFMYEQILGKLPENLAKDLLARKVYTPDLKLALHPGPIKPIDLDKLIRRYAKARKVDFLSNFEDIVGLIKMGIKFGPEARGGLDEWEEMLKK